jgi:uncharacterized YccA/Bax inhibitor family protein
VRETSNPILRNLPKQEGGYAQFGTGVAGASRMGYQADPYVSSPPQAGVSRPLTIDDVVTKTGITLGVLSVVAVISYFLVSSNIALAMPFTLIGSLGGLALVLIASFGRKQDNPAIVLSYAALEGLFLGAISWLFGNMLVQGISAGALITQAILGTVGVFFGMLVVYKTGAIRVTPKFTRFMVAAMVGVLVLMLVIGIAAFSFLLDFDSADQLIRSGAPEKAAWGVALGLTVTLVWLYLEILRLLSYFYSSDR